MLSGAMRKMRENDLFTGNFRSQILGSTAWRRHLAPLPESHPIHTPTLMIQPRLLKEFLVEPGSEVNLKNYVTDWTETDEAKELGKDFIKERAAEILEETRKQLDAAQELLYASDTHSVLIILQAMDAAGKDGTIRHVMSGVNP